MATKVIMPKQGLLMTEGYITKWLISEGEKVEENQPLFEMETDKLSITIESPVSGTLLKIIRGEDETVPITEIIAVIGQEGEDFSHLLTGDSPAETKIDEVKAEAECAVVESNNMSNEKTDRVFITPRAKMRAVDKNINYNDIIGSGPDGLIIEKDILSCEKGLVQNRNKVTPVAEKMIKENNINANEVVGTGISGRVIKQDVLNIIKNEPSNLNNTETQEKIVPFKGMRKVISDRMMESLHNMAQANHRMKVDMTEAIKLRKNLKESEINISYNDILIKIVSKALLEFPYMNSSLTGEGILLKDYVNMGLAVSVSNGLIVPNVKNAHKKSLEEIAIESKELIQKALNGSLSQEDYSGGTFTLSNLGMYDIDEFTAIINPPESGILGVGKVENIPVVENDTIIIKPIMTLSLTYDHRITDGALAAQFLQRIKQLLMRPYLLL
ncbi:2-oxo acid dehydrogenase subunit E2 [Sedimentibacter sp.]|uniref:2-oxo acid dehydrogenase subunit E2 n=1 Tax=Sedimentibacter sp. TaxID=1960295 RepID=UPI0028B190F6|nr:2-oxo acid dehydrogenase subunit E2 [Sedimentibacter sp.]